MKTNKKITLKEYKVMLFDKITDEDRLFLLKHKTQHIKRLSENQKLILKKLEEEYGR